MKEKRTLTIAASIVAITLSAPFLAFGYHHNYPHANHYSNYGSGNYYQNGIYYRTVTVPTDRQGGAMRDRSCHHCHTYHPTRYSGYSVVNTGYTPADRFYTYRPSRNAYRLYEW